MGGVRTTPLDKATSNADFGRRVGVHYTFASRIRNGNRIPSLDTLTRIRKAFDLTDQETAAMMDAADEGPQAFGAWINIHLFDETQVVQTN